MSKNNKPLIFLEPLSQTLKKLKEVLEENSESEGIEIFDVESVEEASQLIPTIGQAVILTASPKTCAITLQSNRKFIKKLQTKTLLLTPKAIPRKTLDKFMKVGLTECIVVPVNPKTLLYKVRLQLRSITAGEPEDDGEMQKKFGEDSAREAIDIQAKVRAEKGIILDEENDSNTPKERKKQAEEETLENYSKPKRKKAEEETIDGFYRGKQKKEEVDYEDEEPRKKKGYQEEVIEGHYKGKVEREEPIEELPEQKRKRAELPELEEDLEAIKRQVNLEVEADFNKKQRAQIEEVEENEKKSKSPSLDIDNDSEEDQIKTKEQEDLGGHYKGDVNKTGLVVENDEEEIHQEREIEEFSDLKGKSSPQLNIEDDQDGEYLDQKEEEVEDFTPKKKETSLDINDDEEDDIVQKPELNLIDDEENKDHIIEEEEYGEIKKKKMAELSLEDDDQEDERDEKKIDDIDGYLRGGKAKKDLNIEDDEDLYKDEKLEEEKERKRKEMASLELYDDNSGKEALLEEESPENESSKSKSSSLDLYDDSDSDRDKASHKDDDADFDRARSNYNEEDTGGFRKRHSAHTEKKEDRHNKSNARADHIKTRYDSREGIKHGEGSWDSNWEKAGVTEQEFGPSAKENEISYENEDLGEQTIDYAQLKKEFESMDLSEVKKKKKEYGEFDNIAQVKTFTKTVLSPTGTLEAMEFEEVQSTEEEEDSQQVFLPDSKGIETVIEVLNFYQKDKIQMNSIYNFITMKLDFLFKGDLTLYIVNQSKSLELTHMGIVLRQLGIAPQAPTEEEAMNKKEFKLLKKEFEEEDKEYQMNALTIQSEWKQKWEVRLSEWQSCQTPKWRDHTFQEEDNEFIFPFYEGISLLGLAIFTPHNKFEESKSGALEVAMESLRAPMLSEYHHSRNEKNQRKKTIVQPKAEKGAKGFFKKWFGKKAS